jgi:hypothetical protein
VHAWSELRGGTFATAGVVELVAGLGEASYAHVLGAEERFN